MGFFDIFKSKDNKQENEEKINKTEDKDNNNIIIEEKDKFYFKLIEYNSMYDIIYSDHKPVYSYFELNYE